MSNDVLAALLSQAERENITERITSLYTLADWLTTRGVIVLPPDHPLRTGEPSEAMHEAAMDVFRAHPGVWVNRDDEWLGLALRAALAVLREPTQRLT